MTEGFHDGGCGCGHVRYRVEGEPIFVNNCHCRQCQQQTGGTSVVNAFYEGERFVLTQGAFSEHIVTAGSGGPHTICRCTACGTAVVSFYPRMGRAGRWFAGRHAGRCVMGDTRRGDLHRRGDAVGRIPRRHSRVRDDLQRTGPAPARAGGKAESTGRAAQGRRGVR
ncbi:GFA family protein [Novosphingobium colocasiae]